ARAEPRDTPEPPPQRLGGRPQPTTQPVLAKLRAPARTPSCADHALANARRCRGRYRLVEPVAQGDLLAAGKPSEAAVLLQGPVRPTPERIEVGRSLDGFPMHVCLPAEEDR